MTGQRQFSMLLALVLSMSSGIEGLPEENLSTPELIKYWGYPSEVHEAETSDGYLLTLHRIPHGKNLKGKPAKGVFFLQHTILSTSADFVMSLPQQNLAFTLADQGYDVWMGNVRGNTYSKKHKTHKIYSSAFWDFSVDEMAKY